MAAGKIRAMQNEGTDRGKLQINVTGRRRSIPIPDAKIQLYYTGDPTSQIEELETDESGQTEQVDLAAPPLEYSMQPGEQQPYSEYTIQISAEGYYPLNISGIDVLPNETAIQEVELEEIQEGGEEENIVIPAHTLYGDYPPKIAEAEVKPVAETGEIVLNRVVIPEYVIVHDGVPTDPTAKNYYVRYRDYVKNVASSEVYATWPDATLRANILAIMSFTLNRVYTEW